MTKITAIFLATTVMLQSFNLKQTDVLKLPTLVAHVFSHLYDGDTFADFIAMHYGDKSDLHKNEHKEHKKLPFNHKNFDSIFTSIFFFELISIPIKSSFTCFFQNESFGYVATFRYLLSYAVFQPPK